MRLVSKLRLLLSLAVTVGVVNSTQLRANHVIAHYIDIGDQGQSQLLTVDGAGDLFVVSKVVEPWGRPQIRATKTDPAGNVLASLDFGGSNLQVLDTVSGAAVDIQGNLVIVGSTYSEDFPLVRPLFSVTAQAAFVVKIDAQLKHILFSTVLGGNLTSPLNGTAFTSARALALDDSGNIYVAGTTDTADFPVTKNAFQKEPPQSDVLGTPSYGFVTEISADGTSLVFSTYFGTSGTVCLPGIHGPNCGPVFTDVSAVRLDPTGAIVIAGNTDANLPVTAGALTSQCGMCGQGQATGFVAKLNAGASKLVWATYMTPSQDSLTGLSISTMVLASDGGVIVGGLAPNNLAVTPGALQPNPPDPDGGGFVAKLDSSGQRLVFATYLGNNTPVTEVSVIDVRSMAVDAEGTIWVTGGSDPAKLPLPAGTPALGPLYTVALSTGGTTLTSATTMPVGAGGMAIVATDQGTIVTLGDAGSLLITSPGPGPSLVGVANSAGQRVSGAMAPLELISFYGVALGPTNPLGAHVVNQGQISVVSTSLGGVQVLFDGVAAPLLYVGPTQINTIVPSEVYGRESTMVQILTPTGEIAGLTFIVKLSQPQVFRGSGTFFALAENQDGSVNSARNPAAPGSIISIWATGAGLSAPGPQPDGQIIPSPLGPLLTPQLPVAVITGASYGSGRGQDSVEVLYAGDANDMVQGVIQVNFRLPTQGAFQLQVGAALSEPFQIYVQ